MLSKYDRGKQDFVINKEEVKSVQQLSRQELEISTPKQQVNNQISKAAEIQNDGFGM